MKRAIPLFVLSTMALTGCALDNGEPDASASEETPIMVTSVRVLPDGTEAIQTAAWSRAELRAAVRERIVLAEHAGVHIDPAAMGLPGLMDEQAAGEGSERVGEAEQAIFVDSLCGNNALWITDNGAYNDLTHMICFDGSGTMAMPSPWVGAYWGGAHTPVELWGGALSGRVWFVNSSCDAGCSVPFDAWEKKSLTSYPGPNSRFDAVTLN